VKCLLIAYFVCNISAKKYQSVHLCQSCSKPKVGRFFGTQCILIHLRYGDGAGNTVEENSSVFSLIRMR